MKFVTVVSSVMSLLALVQLCPAPVGLIDMAIIWVDSAIAGAAVSTAIKKGAGGKRDEIKGFAVPVVKRPGESEHDKRDEWDNLPQPAADECKGQLKSAYITVSPQTNNGVRLDGVPPACMTLATILLGQDGSQPMPIPMGMSPVKSTC